MWLLIAIIVPHIFGHGSSAGIQYDSENHLRPDPVNKCRCFVAKVLVRTRGNGHISSLHAL